MLHQSVNDTAITLSQPAPLNPTEAARQFALVLHDRGLMNRTWRLKCELPGKRVPELYPAVMLGLEGRDFKHANAAATARELRRMHDKREVRLLGRQRIAFDARHHLISRPGGGSQSAVDGIRLSAFDPAGMLLLEETYDVLVK